MIKTFLPLLAIAAAIGLYFMYIQPAREEINKLMEEKKEFQSTLNTADELDKTIERLDKEKKDFREEELDALGKMLPEKIDRVQFVLDLNSVARKHNLEITNIDLGDPSAVFPPTVATVANTNIKDASYFSTEISFNVETVYPKLIPFIKDLEKSLKLIDIEEVTFNTPSPDDETDEINFSLGFNAYSLKK